MIQPHSSEEAYERLTCYRFARRYAEGKSMADIRLDEAGCGARILAGSAGSVTVFAGQTYDPEETAPAPNVSLKKADLLELPAPDGSFEVAAAFGVIEKLEEPEALVAEAKRVLKGDGVLILSTPDKRANSIDRNYRDPENKSEIFVPELREMLERHFEHVEVFRLGSVAGGLVLPEEDLSTAGIETASLSSPSFDTGPPTTLGVLAVCSDSEIPQKEGRRPYLLLDRERSVFEECEERCEDVELLREEVRRLQETEVQAFEEALQLHGGENLSLRGEIRRHRAQLRHLRERNERLEQRAAHADNLRDRLSEVQNHNERLREQAANVERLRDRLNEIEGSYAWRLLKLYRRLRGS